MKDDLFTIEKLYQAYRTCRRHKRGTINALRFEARLLDQLCDLRDELVGRTYHPTTSICFVQRRPKMREIFAADFRDRVVHHLLVGYLEPIFERRFIHDSYACRRDKGVHAGVTRLRGFLNRVTANGTQRAWYLKEDVSGFFMNIDKEVLYQLVCRAVQRADVQWLVRTSIFHDCTEDYHFKGKRGLLQHIPPHKTLFKVPSGKGLPIGNLTSQFFANVYLNELDQFVKRTLRCRYYLRYCDDFLLLGTSPEQLMSWREAIATFLRDTLQLELNQSQHRLRPVADGIDFLGYIVRRRYVLVRRRVVNHLHERLERFERQLSERRRTPAALPARNFIARATLETVSDLSHSPEDTNDGAVSMCHHSLQTAPNRTGRSTVVTAWRYPPHTMQLLRSVLASYLGHFQWADTRKLTSHLFVRYPVLRASFMLQAGGRLVPRYLEGTTSRLRWAYRWWVPPAPSRRLSSGESLLWPLWVRDGRPQRVLVFFPVGRFYEFYGSQALEAHSALGLKLVTGLRGFREGCGFHRKWLGRYLPRALACGYYVALIKDEKGVDGVVHRRLAKLFGARTDKSMVIEQTLGDRQALGQNQIL